MTAICLSLLLATANGASCPPQLEDMKVLVTWYDPSTCITPDGEIVININCDSDPGHFADGTAVAESSYNLTAACIPEWLGRDIIIVGLGAFRCRDTGGSIIIEDNEYYSQYVIRLDVLSHEAIGCNYCLWDWELPMK